jgi:hypothetical protein
MRQAYNPDDMEKGQRQNEAFKSPNGSLFPHLIPKAGDSLWAFQLPQHNSSDTDESLVF